MYLRIATELQPQEADRGRYRTGLRIGRIFRNEGMDTKHNPRIHHRRSCMRRTPITMI
jgi:lysyl-tRNA synthetase class II